MHRTDWYVVCSAAIFILCYGIKSIILYSFMFFRSTIIVVLNTAWTLWPSGFVTINIFFNDINKNVDIKKLVKPISSTRW
jgi:hypothetical protein